MEFLSKENLAIIEKARMRLRAIKNPLRQKILQFILDHNNSTPVKPIYKTLRIGQSVASHQLGILRAAKIVISKKEGKQIFYSVDTSAIKKLIADSKQMIS